MLSSSIGRPWTTWFSTPAGEGKVLSLVLKDLAAARRLLLLILPLGLVHLAVFSSFGPIYFPTACLFAALLAFGPIALEEIHRTEILWNSLPVSRGQIVLARYVTTLIGILAGLAMSWGVGRLAARFIAAEASSPSPFAALRAHILLFSFLVLGMALFLPLYFHFGAGRGTILFSAVGVGLLLVLTVGTQVLLFAKGYSSPILDPESWKATGPELQERVVAWLEPRINRILGLIAGLSIFAIAFSWLVSRRLYENRDL